VSAPRLSARRCGDLIPPSAPAPQPCQHQCMHACMYYPRRDRPQPAGHTLQPRLLLTHPATLYHRVFAPSTRRTSLHLARPTPALDCGRAPRLPVELACLDHCPMINFPLPPLPTSLHPSTSRPPVPTPDKPAHPRTHPRHSDDLLLKVGLPRLMGTYLCLIMCLHVRTAVSSCVSTSSQLMCFNFKLAHAFQSEVQVRSCVGKLSPS